MTLAPIEYAAATSSGVEFADGERAEPYPAHWGMPPTAPAMVEAWRASHIRQDEARTHHEPISYRSSDYDRPRAPGMTMTAWQACKQLIMWRRVDPWDLGPLLGSEARRLIERRRYVPVGR